MADLRSSVPAETGTHRSRSHSLIIKHTVQSVPRGGSWGKEVEPQVFGLNSCLDLGTGETRRIVGLFVDRLSLGFP